MLSQTLNRLRAYNALGSDSKDKADELNLSTRNLGNQRTNGERVRERTFASCERAKELNEPLPALQRTAACELKLANGSLRIVAYELHTNCLRTAAYATLM